MDEPRAAGRSSERSAGHLKPSSRRWLEPPWPDLVIGIGRRTVAVARWIRKQSGGRTQLVRLGHPRAPNRLFDLVITTRQYPVPPGDECPHPAAGDEPLPHAAAADRGGTQAGSTHCRARICSCRSAAPRRCGSSTSPRLRDAAGKLAERAAEGGRNPDRRRQPAHPAEAYDVVREAAGDAAECRDRRAMRCAIRCCSPTATSISSPPTACR